MEVFISYSRRDQVWKDRIKVFLKCMGRNRQVEFRFWSDADIDTGADWERDIKQAIDRSAAVVLLVSSDFMTSDFIMKQELEWIKARADDAAFTIYPIVVRPCPWELDGWLAERNFFNSGAALSLEEEPEIERRLTELVIDMERTLFPDLGGDADEESEALVAELPAVLPKDKPARPPKKKMATGIGVSPSPAKAPELDPEGYRFQSWDEIGALIAKETGHDMVRALQIFRIKTQRTWIATTEREVVCVLDSAKTAARKRLIQWREPLSPPPMVKAKPRAGTHLTGVVSIGRRQNWLFSTKLFASKPDEASGALQTSLKQMFDAARRS